jgi:hypothetical protein
VPKLTHFDPSAINQPGWGCTNLLGHNASGSWFGVHICGNGINAVASSGANLGCDCVPTDQATSSGV